MLTWVNSEPPKIGAFLVLENSYDFPVAVRWATYSSAAQAETGLEGYWAYCDENLDDISAPEFKWWCHFNLPSEV